jgi:hypothetical protein
MIVFGGQLTQLPGICTNEVWVLANASGVTGSPTWIQLNISGTAPSPRAYHSAVYNPVSNQLIVFGGNDCVQTNSNDVWVLSNANGLGGTPFWTQIVPSGTAPAPRDAHTAIYDISNNRMTIFAGRTNPVFGFSYYNLNDVWVLSNANGQGGSPVWTQLFPSNTLPVPRGAHAATYDSASNRMTVFGGATSSLGTTNSPLNDVWVLSNANGLEGIASWTQLFSYGILPPTRIGHSAVYDPGSQRMTIFGGINSYPLLNDVWVLTNAIDTTTVRPYSGSIAQLILQSEPGDYIGQVKTYDLTYTPGNSYIPFLQILSTIGSAPSLIIFGLYNSPSLPPSIPDDSAADIAFGTDQLGIPLQTGFFPDAQTALIATPGHPGLEVGFQGRGCDIQTGSFTINNLLYSHGPAGLKIEEFSASFEQHCQFNQPPLFGTLVFNA